MEGQGRTLYWFQNDKVKAEVPFFQRPYVWDEPEWDELVNSIENAKGGNMPFIGSFILQKPDKESTKYLVIDGQQRITTISIMIKAFIDVFNEHLDDSKPEFLNIIYEKTMNALKSNYKPRLIPSNVDKSDFELVMNIKLDLNDLKDKNGKIIDAYNYFVKYFKENDIDKNLLIGQKILTNNKFFITIILDEDDDEQKIFDSVNSLGKDLTNADIIKNFLYQKMKNSVDASLLEDVLNNHEKYWMNVFYADDNRAFWEAEKILGRIKSNNLEAFLKDFATIKGIYKPSETGGIDGLSKSYKRYISQNLNTYNELLLFSKELAEYAKCYYEYTTNYNNLDSFKIGDMINTTLLILDKTETSTFNPYIMKLLKEKPNNLNDLLWNLQKFLVQRLIYKAKTKNYNKVCENLLSSKDPIDYLTNYNKNEPMGLNEYPSGLKKMNNKPATLVLFLIEMIRRKGEEELYSDGLKYNKSLEHIMPQKWQTNWMNVPCYRYNQSTDLYEEIKDINEVAEQRKNLIYSIGNMTLLRSALNSSIGNKSFEVKIEGNNNFDGIRKFVGGLLVANEIVNTYDETKTWNEENIIKRNKSLFKELNDYYSFI